MRAVVPAPPFYLGAESSAPKRSPRPLKPSELSDKRAGVTCYSSAVLRRNERERNRVRLVNHGFNALRMHVPRGGGGGVERRKKLSKVDTLRSAVEYIRELHELLGLNAVDTENIAGERELRSSSPVAASQGSSSRSICDGRTDSLDGHVRFSLESPASPSAHPECQDGLANLYGWLC